MRNGFVFPSIFGSRFFARQFDQVSGRFFNDLVGAGAEYPMFVNYEGDEGEIADWFDVFVFGDFCDFFVFHGLLVVHRLNTVGWFFVV